VPTKKKKIEANRLTIIECTCGEKILLVPNVKQMSKAIDAHVEEHIKKLKVTKKEKETEEERIRDDLTAKALQQAGED
jgi:hypothetical protein